MLCPTFNCVNYLYIYFALLSSAFFFLISSARGVKNCFAIFVQKKERKAVAVYSKHYFLEFYKRTNYLK